MNDTPEVWSEEFINTQADKHVIGIQKALDAVYGYGVDENPASFGYISAQRNCRRSLRCFLENFGLVPKHKLIEMMSDTGHEGWNEAVEIVIHPDPVKQAKRRELAKTSYADLPEVEKEKYRVGARYLYHAWADFTGT